MLYHKLCVFSLILLLLCLYFYVIKENFDNNTTPTSKQTDTISFQLTNEIARILAISPARIYNLKYEGDIKTNMLNVNFSILDGSVKYKTEKSKNQASKEALQIATNDTFFVSINNQPVKLRHMALIKKDSAFFDNSVYFKNEGLKEVSKFSINKYISVPNDESLTKFYTLEYDKNYKLKPTLN